MTASESAINVPPSQLPLSFIANVGQTDADVRFQVRGAGHTIFFTPDEIVLSASQQLEDETVSSVVRSQLLGANPDASIVGLNELPGVANFLLGSDSSQWYTNVPTYDGVVYRNVYAGIDRVFRGNEGELKSEFIVAPGADPGQIQINFSGVDSIELRDDGALVLQTPLGELIEAAPYIYQEIDGQRYTVQGTYTLLGNNQVGFTLGAYNPAYTLVIDPVLEYSTYLGGSGNSFAGLGINTNEIASITVDNATGSAYLTGFTPSTDFPTTAGAYDPIFNDNPPLLVGDAFVTKLNPSGTGVEFSTFLGGSFFDTGVNLTLDSTGNIYLVGATNSLNFPTLNPLQATFGGGADVDTFVALLNPTGTQLLYSTYLGGNQRDGAFNIALDSANTVYISGQTLSPTFPVTANAFQTTYNGNGDGFIVRLDPNAAPANQLLYSSFFGGIGFDSANFIALTNTNTVYITGDTNSPNLPIAGQALLPTFNGGDLDGFVANLDLSAAPANQVLYSTYFGGNSYDSADGIVLDSAGNAYITGETESTNLLTTAGALQTTYGGNRDAFVAQLNPNGLVYSTYLGGSARDSADSLAVDSAGRVYVTGETASATDFPIVRPVQATYGGGTQDAYVAAINPTGTALLYSSFLGGNGYDEGHGIVVDSSGTAYVTGETSSLNFPVTANAFQTTYGGGERDVFVTKIRLNTAPVLDDSGLPNLTAINENDTNNVGSLVSAILANLGGTGITDADNDPLGIAVTAVDNTNGTWQFSTDGGGTWTPLGTPSDNEARLLASDANTKIRFVPNPNFDGTVATGITFRAWDGTLGTNGGTANITAIGTGGATPFSITTETAAIAVNDTGTSPLPPPLPNDPTDVITIGDSTGTNQLLFSLNQNDVTFVNEVGVFVTDDDQGTINGIAPGQAGYLQAALTQGRTIFSALSDLPNGFGVANQNRTLSFEPNTRLAFYFVQNSTADTVLAELAAGQTPTNVFFSVASANSDGFDHLRQSDQGNGAFIQRWEDELSGGDQDFNDLVMTIQPTAQPPRVGTQLQGETQQELIDLRSQTAGIQAQFTLNREAAFDNFCGFYRAVDTNGGIDIDGNGTADVRPGEVGYVQAAIQQRVQNLDLTVANQSTATFSAQLEAGFIYVPFLIANGRPDALLDANSTNDPAFYCSFIGANADGVDHVRLLGDNIFGFEDLPGGGDRDYNDMIVQVNLG